MVQHFVVALFDRFGGEGHILVRHGYHAIEAWVVIAGGHL
jgi:hypothetical protein